MGNISTAGITAQSILQIRSAQSTMNDLSNQLATGKKSIDYADYTFTETRNLINFSTTIDKSNSYLNVINTVQPRLKVYASSLSKLNEMADKALPLINTTQGYNAATNLALGEQIKTYLSDAGYYLNQKVGDRFIFSGTGARYTTAPVVDPTTLPVPPAVTDITAVSSPVLPTYDTGAPGSNALAYAKDTANIDTNYNITYGVSSNETGIQNLVLGLRWAYAATQDPANYNAYMETARGLLESAKPQLRDLQANVAANQNRLTDVKSTHTNLITDLSNQADAIQGADSATVAAQITFMQSRLEASYTVTGRIAQLSITKYL
ncbi:MAG: hypothetical protein EB059_06360 [Alphaproteobacteria bacterium]|nr:hypothetical protein [Alphaproteobacteria bacterium]